MSFVGPRPPVSYELGPWENYTPHMLKRFEVKPGITGLAQVSGRNDLSWDDKIYFDNIYVDMYAKYGFIYDLILLFRTVIVVFRGKDTIEKHPDKSSNIHGPISSLASTNLDNAGHPSKLD